MRFTESSMTKELVKQVVTQPSRLCVLPASRRFSKNCHHPTHNTPAPPERLSVFPLPQVIKPEAHHHAPGCFPPEVAPQPPPQHSGRGH